MRMTLETAMVWLKRGYRIRRNHWENKFLFIEDTEPLGERIMTMFPDGHTELTTLNAGEILADDWVVQHIWDTPPTLDMSFCGSHQCYDKRCRNCVRNLANYANVPLIPITRLTVESPRKCSHYLPKE